MALPSLRPWRACIFAALAVGVAIWVVESSHRFQECIDIGKHQAIKDGSSKDIAYLSGILGVRRECLGEFIHQNGEAITATFTVVLAISTIFLWISTRDAAYAAKAAADHISNVERAVIYGGVKFGELIVENGIRCVKITISMANYGKTPGFIRHIETGSSELNALPDTPFTLAVSQSRICTFQV
jgi:hypothetical protein